MARPNALTGRAAPKVPPVFDCIERVASALACKAPAGGGVVRLERSASIERSSLLKMFLTWLNDLSLGPILLVPPCTDLVEELPSSSVHDAARSRPHSKMPVRNEIAVRRARSGGNTRDAEQNRWAYSNADVKVTNAGTGV